MSHLTADERGRLTLKSAAALDLETQELLAAQRRLGAGPPHPDARAGPSKESPSLHPPRVFTRLSEETKYFVDGKRVPPPELPSSETPKDRAFALQVPAVVRQELSEKIVAYAHGGLEPALDIVNHILETGIAAYLHVERDDMEKVWSDLEKERVAIEEELASKETPPDDPFPYTGRDFEK